MTPKVIAPNVSLGRSHKADVLPMSKSTHLQYMYKIYLAVLQLLSTQENVTHVCMHTYVQNVITVSRG